MSHAEAERLISSRLDAPLDLNQNRVLLAHLATCASCRAFAQGMESMSTEFRALPMLPASPVVSRQVRTRIAQQPSPWSWLSGALFNGRWGAVPAAIAGVALVAAIAVTLILRGSGPNDGSSPLAAPSTTKLALASATSDASRTPKDGNSTLNVALALTPKFVNVQVTSTPTPVNTAQPTATATAPPSDTATVQPTDTATVHPTDTATVQPSNTATALPVVVPKKTPTAKPTRKPANTPTDTPEATVTSEPTQVPTDTATVESTQTPVDTATAEPTQTPVDTATVKPTQTPVDTATSKPTATPESTETPTEAATIAPAATDTATAELTATPKPIEPDVLAPASPVAQPTETPTRPAVRKPTKTPKPADTPTSPPDVAPTIAPQDGSQSSAVIDTPPGDQPTDATIVDVPTIVAETPTDASADAQIVPIGTQDVIVTDTPEPAPPSSSTAAQAKPTKTPKSNRKPTETTVTATGSGAKTIGEAQQLAQMPASIAPGAIVRVNPAGNLFVVADDSGCTIYDFSGNVVGSIPGARQPFWSAFGTAMLISGDGAKASIWTINSQSVFPINAPADGSYVDSPAGADAGAFYFVRSFADRIEVHRTLLDGASNPDSAIWSGKEQLSGEPVVTDAGVVFAAGGSFWTVTPDGTGTQVGNDPFGDVRAPLRSPGGAGFAFVSGDQIVAAPSGNPGSAASIPYSAGSGGGFTFSPSGDQLAVANGNSLSIYANDGKVVGQNSAADGANLTVVAWTNDGIYVVENGELPVLRLVSPDTVTATAA